MVIWPGVHMRDNIIYKQLNSWWNGWMDYLPNYTIARRSYDCRCVVCAGMCSWTSSTRTHTGNTTRSCRRSSATDPVTLYSKYSHGGRQQKTSQRRTSHSWTTGNSESPSTTPTTCTCRLASWTACQHVNVMTGPGITGHASTCWQFFSMA